MDTNGQPVYAAITVNGYTVDTSDGNFSMEIASGAYTATISEDLGAVFAANFPIDLSSSQTGVVLTVPATVTVTVQVNDPNGNPVPGALVKGGVGNCVPPSFQVMPGVTTNFESTGLYPFNTTTDSNGQVSEPSMPCDSSSGTVTAYPPDGDPLAPGTASVPASYDSDITVTVALQPGSTFSGKVVDSNGQPVYAAITVGGVTVHTSNGNFSLVVTPGVYTATISEDLGAVFAANFPIDLTSSQTGVVLTVPATVTVTVQVDDPNGNPVAGALVRGGVGNCVPPSFQVMPGVTTNFESTGLYPFNTTTDSNGQVSEPSMPCDSASGTVTAYPPSGIPLAPGTASVPASYDSDITVTVALQPGSTFSGKVVDSNGQPVYAAITVGGYTVHTSNGSFSFQVPPGVYTATISEDLGAVFAANFPIDLTSSQTGDVLTLPATVTVTVQVNDPSGHPVPGALVKLAGSNCVAPSFDVMPGVTTSLESTGLYAFNVTTDSNGQASEPSMPCDSSSGTVTAYPPSGAPLAPGTASVPASYDTDITVIVVLESADVAPSITSASQTAFIVGSAGSFTVTANGYPAPSISESGALPRGVTFTSNPNGTATLSGTPAAGTSGMYMLSLTAANGTQPNAAKSFTLYVDASLSGYPKLPSGAYNLANANLKNAYLADAALSGASLSNANLMGAVLDFSNLTGANFTSANLKGVSFVSADLAGADFASTNLKGAIFTGADLKGATGLTSANLSGATWSNTTCPDGTLSNADGGTCTGHL